MPAARISSAVAGRSPPIAFTALPSFVSLTSKSPRTMAVTSRPSPATKKAALAVREVGTSRRAARAAMVSVPGVSTSSTGIGSSPSGGRAATRATCWLAAWPHASHSTSVSSPCGLMTMNSCAPEPPMIPTSDPTATVRRPSRAKMRS